MRTLIACLPVLMLVAACASGGSMADAEVDVMFRRTEAVTDGVLELTTPALVSKPNGAYQIEAIAYYPGASLSPDGRIADGTNAVFSLQFIDLGDISVLRTDDKRVSLRAEFGAGGKVTSALLGSSDGTVSDGFVGFSNDTFESGSWEVMYDGPDLVVGRFDLKFRKYRAAGNFRAPRLR
ncbi:MAG: hypothetical protein K8I27_04755 [Planctomycetes bacterium]|nr:hypothetical protein [Planctomycetota bacterium]